MAKNVLVATPQAAFGELIRMSLEESGNYEVRLVQTAAEARTNLPRKNYVLAILDSGLLDESIVNLSQALMAQKPDLCIILIPPDNNPDHPLIKGFTPHGFLSQPFYMPDLIQMADQILGHMHPEPDEAGQNGDGDEPAELPQWVQDTSQAGAYLAHLLKETTARAAMITRKGKVYSQAGDLDEKSTYELAAQLVRYWDGGDRSDMARYLKLQYSGEHFIYARMINPELVLALVYAPNVPIQKSRIQTNLVRRMILHTPPPAEVLEEAHPADELVSPEFVPAVLVAEVKPIVEEIIPETELIVKEEQAAAPQIVAAETMAEESTEAEAFVAEWLETLSTGEAINERMPVVDDFLTEVAPQTSGGFEEEEPLLDLSDNIFVTPGVEMMEKFPIQSEMAEAEEEPEPLEQAAIVSDLPYDMDEFEEIDTVQAVQIESEVVEAVQAAQVEPEVVEIVQAVQVENEVFEVVQTVQVEPEVVEAVQAVQVEPEVVEAVQAAQVEPAEGVDAAALEKEDFQKRLIDELARLGDRKPAGKPVEPVVELPVEIPRAVEPPTVVTVQDDLSGIAEGVDAAAQEKEDFQKRLIDELARLDERKPAGKPVEPVVEIPLAVEPPTKELNDTDFDAFDMSAVEKTPLEVKEETPQAQTPSDDRRLEEAIAQAVSARVEKAPTEPLIPVQEAPTKELKDTDFEAFDLEAVERAPLPKVQEKPRPESASSLSDDDDHLTLEIARKEAARLSRTPGEIIESVTEPKTKELKDTDFEAFDMTSVEKIPLSQDKPRAAAVMPPKAVEPPTKELTAVDFNALDFSAIEKTPTEPLPEPPISPPDATIRMTRPVVPMQAGVEIPKAVEPPTKELTAMDFEAFDVSAAEKEPVAKPKPEPQIKQTARDRRLAALHDDLPAPENQVPTKELTEMDFDAFDMTSPEVSKLSNQEQPLKEAAAPHPQPQPQDNQVPIRELTGMDFESLDVNAAEIVKLAPETPAALIPEAQRLGGKPRMQLQPQENQVPTRELDNVDFAAFDMSATEVAKTEPVEPAPKRKTTVESLRLGGKPRPQLQPQDNQMPTRELDRVDFAAFDLNATETSAIKEEPGGHELPFLGDTPPAKPVESTQVASPFLAAQRKKASQPLTPVPEPPTKELNTLDFEVFDTQAAEVTPASKRKKQPEPEELRVPTKDLTGDIDFEALDVKSAEVVGPEAPKPEKRPGSTAPSPKLPDDLLIKPFEVPSPADIESRPNPDHEELLEEPLPELDSWLRTLPTPAEMPSFAEEDDSQLTGDEVKLADLLAGMPPPDPQKNFLQGMGEWMPAAEPVSNDEQLSLRDLVLPWEEEKEDIDDENMPTSPLKIVSQHIEETKGKTAPLRSRAFTGQLSKGKGAIPVGADAKKTQPLKPVAQVNFFTFILIPDHPKQFLSGNVGKWLEQEIAKICQGNNWKFDKVITKPEHLIVIMETPANIPIEEVVAEIRNKTSSGLFKRFNDLKTLEPGGDFWAHRELITDGNQQPTRDNIKNFVSSVRQAQGY
jgi:REP element-mobilizing transposase RayT/DNA-binding response OmpR family regulator